jgi:MGT family glycosyltransferase
MSLSFLFTSWGNPGNLNPFLTAARRLRLRGHRVRILGEPDHQEETAKAGFDSISWRRPPALSAPPASDEEPVWAEIRALLGQVTFGGAIDYAADTMDAIRSEPVDAILTNDLLAGPAIAAEAAGIPYALLAPHVSVRPLDGVPTGVTGLVPNDSTEYQAAEQTLRAHFIELLSSNLPALNRARAAFGLSPLNHIFDHYDRADRVLIGMSAAFDFPATRLPANLCYVGPLLDVPQWAQSGAEPWTAPWSENRVRPRVLVSLSTSFQNQADLLRRIVAALGTMDLDAVVTVGPAMIKENFEAPANVSIIHSAPHDAVMKQVSLVVTHGGHGTVTRSLLNGVPLLVIPMGRDQGDNAARVVARGTGLSLADGATAQEIVSAVRRLLVEPHFRAAAVRLGKTMAQNMTSPLLVMEMEQLAMRGWRRSA